MSYLWYTGPSGHGLFRVCHFVTLIDRVKVGMKSQRNKQLNLHSRTKQSLSDGCWHSDVSPGLHAQLLRCLKGPGYLYPQRKLVSCSAMCGTVEKIELWRAGDIRPDRKAIKVLFFFFSLFPLVCGIYFFSFLTKLCLPYVILLVDDLRDLNHNSAHTGIAQIA